MLLKKSEDNRYKRRENLDTEKIKKLISEYRKFKMKNVKHFRFDENAIPSVFGRFQYWYFPAHKLHPILGEEIESTVQLVQIYFDTVTFDKIEREKKIKVEAQLSLVGGSMGLLTGFSIISAIEVIFFLFRSTRNWIILCLMINEWKLNYKYEIPSQFFLINYSTHPFPIRLACSLRINMTGVVSAVKQKFQKHLRIENWEYI